MLYKGSKYFGVMAQPILIDLDKFYILCVTTNKQVLI